MGEKKMNKCDECGEPKPKQKLKFDVFWFGSITCRDCTKKLSGELITKK